MSLNNEIYKQKYLKYKMKYLELKQHGGKPFNFGDYIFFYDTQKYNIYDTNDSTIKYDFNKFINAIGDNAWYYLVSNTINMTSTFKITKLQDNTSLTVESKYQDPPLYRDPPYKNNKALIDESKKISSEDDVFNLNAIYIIDNQLSLSNNLKIEYGAILISVTYPEPSPIFSIYKLFLPGARKIYKK